MIVRKLKDILFYTIETQVVSLVCIKNFAVLWKRIQDSFNAYGVGKFLYLSKLKDVVEDIYCISYIAFLMFALPLPNYLTLIKSAPIWYKGTIFLIKQVRNLKKTSIH